MYTKWNHTAREVFLLKLFVIARPLTNAFSTVKINIKLCLSGFFKHSHLHQINVYYEHFFSIRVMMMTNNWLLQIAKYQYHFYSLLIIISLSHNADLCLIIHEKLVNAWPTLIF